jgi:hypothetical protein
MEMQTFEDGSGSVFVVTDLLRGFRYFVAARGSHYEIEIPRKAGHARIAVSLKADVIDVADELVQLLDSADQVCSTSSASVKSAMSSSDLGNSTSVMQFTTHTA